MEFRRLVQRRAYSLGQQLSESLQHILTVEPDGHVVASEYIAREIGRYRVAIARQLSR